MTSTIEKYELRRKEVLNLVSKNGLTLKNMAPYFLRDIEIVTAAVTNNGMALKYADKTILKNKDIVAKAIFSNAYIMEHLTKEHKQDRENILAALKNKNGFYSGAYRYLPVRLKMDGEILEIISVLNPLMLRYAPKKIKNNKEICEKFIKNEGMALEFASSEIKDDRCIAIMACYNYPIAVRHVSETLRKDPRFVVEVIESLNPKELFISTVLSCLPEEIVFLYQKDSKLSFLKEEAKRISSIELKIELEKQLCYNEKIGKNKVKV